MEGSGPVQIMVLGFEGTEFTGEILRELRRLKESDLVRVIDLVAVVKDEQGDIAAVELSDLTDEERSEFGAIAGALIGLGIEGDEDGFEAGAIAGAEAAEEGILGEEAAWSIADVIPLGSRAAVALARSTRPGTTGSRGSSRSR